MIEFKKNPNDFYARVLFIYSKLIKITEVTVVPLVVLGWLELTLLEMLV